MHSELRSRYLVPGVFTSLERFGAMADELPSGVTDLARAVQSILLHRWWAHRYGVEVTPERETEMCLHGAEATIACAMELSDLALGLMRPPERRALGICRHFSTVLVTLLRRKGVPARARCGFANYFAPWKYEDHWVTEYWSDETKRWILFDAQLDDLQRERLAIDFDPADTPRDRFLVGGDVWLRYQQGEIPGDTCGFEDIRGEWFIRGNHALDIASLQGFELLPWESFGIGNGAQPTPDDVVLLNETAELTRRGDDDSIAALLDLAGRDERLRPPVSLVRAAAANDESEPSERVSLATATAVRG